MGSEKWGRSFFSRLEDNESSDDDWRSDRHTALVERRVDEEWIESTQSRFAYYRDIVQSSFVYLLDTLAPAWFFLTLFTSTFCVTFVAFEHRPALTSFLELLQIYGSAMVLVHWWLVYTTRSSNTVSNASLIVVSHSNDEELVEEPSKLPPAPLMPSSESHVGAIWCGWCQLYQPPRVTHCRFCAECVLKRQHHCYVTRCCIGFYNQRYFVTMCLWAVLAALATLVQSALFIFYTFPWTDLLLPLTLNRYLSGRASLIELCLSAHVYNASFAALLSGYYLLLHLCLTLSGRTFYEYRRKLPRSEEGSALQETFGKLWWLQLLVPIGYFVQQGSVTATVEKTIVFDEENTPPYDKSD